MAERRVNVGWAEGLHARPASIFVRAATASGIPVTIAKAGSDPVNARSMLAVLGLGAQGGEEIGVWLVFLSSPVHDLAAGNHATAGTVAG
ncbi:HPr family phosphocarrier protein, partial [Streptomyces sp. NPDC004279]